MQADPRFLAPGKGKPLQTPASMHLLQAYKIHKDSPLVGAGLDLQQLFAINAGRHDYLLNPFPRSRVGMSLASYCPKQL